MTCALLGRYLRRRRSADGDRAERRDAALGGRAGGPAAPEPARMAEVEQVLGALGDIKGALVPQWYVRQRAAARFDVHESGCSSLCPVSKP